MKVFVILVHREHDKYTPSSEVYCVTNSFATATTQMNKCFEEEKNLWETEYDFDKEEIIITKGSEAMSLYNGFGEFTEITIEKKELI